VTDTTLPSTADEFLARVLGPEAWLESSPARGTGALSGEAALEILRAVGDRLQSASTLGLFAVENVLASQAGSELIVQVRPGGRVGFTATNLPDGKQGELVQVHPKVQGADYLGLMLLAEDASALHWDHSAVLSMAADQHSLAELFATAMECETGELVSRVGLRRLHERVDETLLARVRGRVQVSRYLGNLASGRLLDIPCNFERHQVDNLPNRTLRWALKLARRILELRGRDPNGTLKRIREHEFLFDTFRVSHAPVSPQELRGLDRLPSGFDGYKRALSVARLLIRNVTPEISNGGLTSISLAVGMSDTFEDAFASLCHGLVSGIAGARVVVKPPWALTPKGKVEPDVVLCEGGNVLVLDTKWKSVIEDGREKSEREATTSPDHRPDLRDAVLGATDLPSWWNGNLRFNYGDLHQMWSYLHVASVRADPQPTRVTGALIYPVAPGHPNARLEPIEVRPAGTSAPAPRRLFLVPLERWPRWVQVTARSHPHRAHVAPFVR
jgi:hypothetical protein